MAYDFNKIRFALFTKSYAGNLIRNYFGILSAKDKKPAKEKLARVLLLNRNSIKCFILHRTCMRKFSKIANNISKNDEKISVYLQIEKELFILSQEKKDNLTSEDYEHALLEPAIERIVGNVLAKDNNDGEFEEKLIELMRVYSIGVSTMMLPVNTDCLL